MEWNANRVGVMVVAAVAALTGCHQREVSNAAQQPGESRPTEPRQAGQFSPDVVIATYSSEDSKSRLLDKASKIGATVVYDYTNFSMVALRKPEKMTLQETIEELKSVEGVLGVVEDQMCELDSNVNAALP